MIRTLAPLAALLALALPAAAQANLAVGAKAPSFATASAKAGKAKRFHLAEALQDGPVVLYFYPKAFTEGCTLETKAFADAHNEFAAAGATVIGMSNDDLPTLKKFSTEACGSKFAVGIATPHMIEGYDVDLVRDGQSTGLTQRTSYVIAPDGSIAFVHSDMDYRDHVRLTLDAVKKLSR